MAKLRDPVLNFITKDKDPDLAFLLVVTTIFCIGQWFGSRFEGSVLYNVPFYLLVLLIFIKVIRSL